MIVLETVVIRWDGLSSPITPWEHTHTTTPHKDRTTTMAAALAHDNLPPATYGCSPALLLNSPAASRSVSAVAASAVASAGDATGSGGDATAILSTVFVHPIVLLSVLDHHTRRQEGAGRVIGTLLGKRDGDRVR